MLANETLSGEMLRGLSSSTCFCSKHVHQKSQLCSIHLALDRFRLNIQLYVIFKNTSFLAKVLWWNLNASQLFSSQMLFPIVNNKPGSLMSCQNCVCQWQKHQSQLGSNQHHVCSDSSNPTKNIWVVLCVVFSSSSSRFKSHHSANSLCSSPHILDSA